MNIFDQAPEFIEWDNRKEREINRVTAESTYNRLSVQLPDWLVKGRTVLDLGSCLGAAGHLALTNGARHYTGVEIQPRYVADSKTLLGKYWPESDFSIYEQNIEEYLDECISIGVQYDVVVASGVLYAFLNIVGILEKISKVSSYCVTIDTMFLPQIGQADRGYIVVRPNMPMNFATGAKTFAGLGSTCNLRALDLIMGTNFFKRDENTITPPVTYDSHDGYTDSVEHKGDGIDKKGPVRYMTRYYRTTTKNDSLLDKIKKLDESSITDFYKVPPIIRTAKDKGWKFDEAVASRFQQEAETQIPNYHQVIDMCVSIAKQINVKPDDKIIDVGSALGYTVNKFIENGFPNTFGVDNSEAMVAKSLHQDKITISDDLPDQIYKMIIMNWTLHFIVDKVAYLTNVYNRLSQGGYFILSEKTSQSGIIKNLYYDFKESNGVSRDYIVEKEKRLRGFMHTMPAPWYFERLKEIGFSNIEVINANLGFITIMCKK
jgi:SAM-dependent methyltransferase